MDIAEYERLNRAMTNSWIKCQSALDFDAFGHTLDEMSVLLTNDDLNAYQEFAAQEELSPTRHTPYMKWFNGTADDMVMTDGYDGEPLSAFQVRFEFFKGQLDVTEDRELPWRVEAMAVLGGFAPLHTEPMGRVVHASYKLGSRHDYVKELERLKELGLESVAHYRNSYGMFSYWTNAGFPYGAADIPILLKPRCNLRDNLF